MAVVHTVTGPIDSGDLGRVLMHEHVFVMSPEFRTNYLPHWDEAAAVDAAAASLTALQYAGIDTIVDPTVLGLGRDVSRVKAVAQRTALKIVAATGMYVLNDIPLQFALRGPGLMVDVAEPMTEMFLRDLTEEIGDSGVRAAFLKCAIDSPGLTPAVERVMRAVGQASVQTGAPITVHTDPHTRSGLVAQRVLREEGVDLSKVVVGHSGDSCDIEYLCQVADQGSLLGMDRFGVYDKISFADKIATVVEMARRGYADRIVISHDAACFTDQLTPEEISRVLPDWRFRHISDDVIPELRRRGVNDQELDAMLIGNPRRYFE